VLLPSPSSSSYFAALLLSPSSSSSKIALQRNAAKKATAALLPSPSSSSYFATLHCSAVKKALLPSPSSSSYFVELQRNKKGNGNIATIAFFFSFLQRKKAERRR